APRSGSHPAVDGKNPRETDVYTVNDGRLTGVYTADGQVEVFCGVPYAKPPVGELRWKEPQDPDKWTGILKADRFAPMSMQTSYPQVVASLVDLVAYHQFKPELFGRKERMSEDSLYLNVWKPAGEAKDLPVLVYVHGGSLQTGQPWYADYSGEGLARQGVIVVNMGYRLGVYGFYADEELKAESEHGTTGNYGLLDQIKALEWVKNNVSAFGGDPSNVTLAGESAGAACVSALLTSPLAQGLFRRAVIESSTVTAPEPAHSYRSLEQAYETGKELKKRVGASTVDELRVLDAKAILSGTNDNHHLTIDGYVLTEPPYESLKKGICNAEEIFHGYNAKEGNLFILLDPVNLKSYEQKVRTLFGKGADKVLELSPASTEKEAKENWQILHSAFFFEYGHVCLTRQAQACGVPVYEYFFTKENKRLGGNHGGEEVYLYGNLDKYPRHYGVSDRALAGVTTAYMANFIKTGDPNGAGLPEFPRAQDPAKTFEFGEQIGSVDRRHTELFAVMDELYGFETKKP
ncbi:MAG: carboxylesterase family protein, partial [Clostridia bacterium]|nr:carboxylesterase family protein [Clostridia bacterium]